MELEKPYYTINEVAAMFNVNASLLRYWEKEFTQIKPYKNKKGDRRFTRQDIETIRTIYTLTKEKGYTLQGAKDVLKQGTKPEPSKKEVVVRLQKLKERLLEIRDSLN